MGVLTAEIRQEIENTNVLSWLAVNQPDMRWKDEFHGLIMVRVGLSTALNLAEPPAHRLAR